MTPGSRVTGPRVGASISLRLTLPAMLTLPALLAQLVIPVGPTPAAATSSTRPSISIAAASDLRYAMGELTSAFITLRPDHSIMVTYGSSGNFFAQITNGAPFDVFFSADIAYARRLEEAGHAVPGSTRLYARGRIVTWVRDSSPIDVDKPGLAALLDPAAERVAIANPEHAPYGRAAQAALEAAGLWEIVRPRIVLGENVSQAAQFVESGAADVGIIALSLAIGPPLQELGRFSIVPQELHPPIDQAAVVLAAAADPMAAAAFLDFVLGPDGRPVLDGYGFDLPER